MNFVAQTAVIAGVALVGGVVTFKVVGPPERGVVCRQEALKPGEICLEEVKRRWGGNVLWIDARQRTDWEKNGLAGSLLWNLSEDQQAFEAAAMERLVEGLPVIVYCDSVSCGVSAQVAGKIRALEIAPEVHSLHGGAEALKAAGMLRK
jgi:rhodanese-related sulfurtransferase